MNVTTVRPLPLQRPRALAALGCCNRRNRVAGARQRTWLLRRRCSHDLRTAALEPGEAEGEATDDALDASSGARRSWMESLVA